LGIALAADWQKSPICSLQIQRGQHKNC